MSAYRTSTRGWIFRSTLLTALVLGLAAGMTRLSAQETPVEKPAADNFLSSLQWIKGPSPADIGKMAKIDVPEGYVFLGAKDTQKLLVAMQNLISERELGLIGPQSLDWFVVFEFSDIGYVKDEEKDKLDADKMLASLREGSIESNKERKRRGYSELKLVGWEVPPRYDPETQNLEWALRFESEGSPVVNFNTRRLGRNGVMEVGLVVGPEELTATLPLFKNLLKGYSFKGGHAYAEYRQGDKIAKYGLTALVTGGALAVAAKSGLLSKLWKPILIGLVAIGAWFKRLIFGGRREEN
jgi:uncharacterized membrane-anchored protein